MRRGDEFYPVRRDRERGLSRWGFGEEPGLGGFGGSPWQTMRRMQEDMDRLFAEFFGAGLTSAGAQGAGEAGNALQQARPGWAPHIDISQTDREWCIEADLPGVNRDDIDVQIQNNHLVLTAELRQEPQQGGEGQGEGQGQRQYHRRERRYGYFQRVLPLPENADEQGVTCEFRNGVLTIHLPKARTEQPRGRRIPITEGAGAGTTGAGLPAGTGGNAGQGTTRTDRAGTASGQTGTTGGRTGGFARDEERTLAGAKGGERQAAEGTGAAGAESQGGAAGGGEGAAGKGSGSQARGGTRSRKNQS
jgi:HSP20 family protein